MIARPLTARATAGWLLLTAILAGCAGQPVNPEATRVVDKGARPPAAPAAPAAAADLGPIFKLDIPDWAPVKGERDAAIITIIEFSEFQCPFCGRVVPTLEELLQRYPGKIRVVFRHNPLGFHKDAFPAALAVQAAARQGKFWELHDRLFANREALSEDELFGHAAKLGLDMQRFERDFRSAELLREVEADQAEAERFKARGVPTFYVNGRLFVGAQPLENFTELIDSLLPEAQATGLRGDALYRQLVRDGLSEGLEPRRPPRPSAPPEDDKVVEVPAGDSYVVGAEDAPVEIVMFGDYQCPFCARAQATLDELLPLYPGKLRLVFKHYPLPFHQDAALAAEAALAAGEQGRFFEMHRLLYERQRSLAPEKLIEYAAELGLDAKRFAAELESGRFRTERERDSELAKGLGVNGVPTFFVNGRRLSGAQPLEEFRKRVERALGERGLGPPPAEAPPEP